ATRHADVVLVVPWSGDSSLPRERLTRGGRQLVVVGLDPSEIPSDMAERVRVATLGLHTNGPVSLRLSASIVLAEIARQVGRRRPVPGKKPQAPRYQRAVELVSQGEAIEITPSELLDF